MLHSIEELQKKLQEQIAALAEQRQQEAQRVEQHIAQINAEAEIERKQRIEEYKKKEEARLAREKLREEEAEKERKEIEKKRFEVEQAANAAAQAQQEQQEKLEWLQNEISKHEFMEEQHRKAIENAKAVAENNSKQKISQEEINIEHPLAPENQGEAVQGTEGATPDTALMSIHLKRILRQATRSY